MAYPMTYRRVVDRNSLHGNYDPEKGVLALIAGDLRRLEIDQRDDRQLEIYAKAASITKEQVLVVLDEFFYGDF